MRDIHGVRSFTTVKEMAHSRAFFQLIVFVFVVFAVFIFISVTVSVYIPLYILLSLIYYTAITNNQKGFLKHFFSSAE